MRWIVGWVERGETHQIDNETARCGIVPLPALRELRERRSLGWTDVVRLLRSRRLAAASRRATARFARAQDEAVFLMPSTIHLILRSARHPQDGGASRRTHSARAAGPSGFAKLLHFGRGLASGLV